MTAEAVVRAMRGDKGEDALYSMRMRNTRRRGEARECRRRPRALLPLPLSLSLLFPLLPLCPPTKSLNENGC